LTGYRTFNKHPHFKQDRVLSQSLSIKC
jgi:hypothetical protein